MGILLSGLLHSSVGRDDGVWDESDADLRRTLLPPYLGIRSNNRNSYTEPASGSQAQRENTGGRSPRRRRRGSQRIQSTIVRTDAPVLPSSTAQQPQTLQPPAPEPRRPNNEQANTVLQLIHSTALLIAIIVLIYLVISYTRELHDPSSTSYGGWKNSPANIKLLIILGSFVALISVYSLTRLYTILGSLVVLKMLLTRVFKRHDRGQSANENYLQGSPAQSLNEDIPWDGSIYHPGDPNHQRRVPVTHSFVEYWYPGPRTRQLQQLHEGDDVESVSEEVEESGVGGGGAGICDEIAEAKRLRRLRRALKKAQREQRHVVEKLPEIQEEEIDEEEEQEERNENAGGEVDGDCEEEEDNADRKTLRGTAQMNEARGRTGLRGGASPIDWNNPVGLEDENLFTYINEAQETQTGTAQEYGATYGLFYSHNPISYDSIEPRSSTQGNNFTGLNHSGPVWHENRSGTFLAQSARALPRKHTVSSAPYVIPEKRRRVPKAPVRESSKAPLAEYISRLQAYLDSQDQKAGTQKLNPFRGAATRQEATATRPHSQVRKMEAQRIPQAYNRPFQETGDAQMIPPVCHMYDNWQESQEAPGMVQAIPEPAEETREAPRFQPINTNSAQETRDSPRFQPINTGPTNWKTPRVAQMFQQKNTGSARQRIQPVYTEPTNRRRNRAAQRMHEVYAESAQDLRDANSQTSINPVVHSNWLDETRLLHRSSSGPSTITNLDSSIYSVESATPRELASPPPLNTDPVAHHTQQ